MSISALAAPFTRLTGFVKSAMTILALLLVVGLGQQAAAADFGATKTQFATKTTSNTSADTMTGQVGNVVNSVAQIITGPVLYVVMGVAIMIAVYGFVQGKMMMAFMGIGGFVLAGALKALFGTFSG